MRIDERERKKKENLNKKNLELKPNLFRNDY